MGLFPEFSSPGSGIGSGGQISKVILIFQDLYQVVQFDELSRMVQYFSYLTFLSQVTIKNSAKVPKIWGPQ